MAYDAKRVYLIEAERTGVGVIECVVGYPVAATLMLGLLVLDERWQGRGLGRRAVRWLEHYVGERQGCTRVRLGVIASDAGALGFWEAMGYQRTGAVQQWAQGSVRSEVIVFEKDLAPDA